MLVIGGGLAGMAAALRAAEMGADVVLVDDGPELGGTQLAGGRAGSAQELGARVRAAGVEVLARPRRSGSSTASSPSGSGNTLHQIRADATSPPRARSSSR